MLALLLGCWGGFGPPALAQSTAPSTAQVRGEFRAPLLSQGRQVGLLTGQGADLQDDGSIRLRTARVEYTDAGGNTNANLIVLATNCVADLKRNVVWSPDGLGLRTADGQFALDGFGFVWTQTNNELVVSNRVRTLVRKGEATDAEAVHLRIESGHFRFSYASNVVVFRDAVRAEDPEMGVECERLTVRRSPSGKFDHIVAEDAVRILSRRDGSVTTAARAEYTLSDSGERMELTGEPHWRDAVREARAERFVLQRTRKPEPQLMRAEGNAWMRLPAGTNDLGAWPMLSSTPGTAGTAPDPLPAAAETNTAPRAARQLELSSGLIMLALPPTNGPVQGLVAETNVLIQSRLDGWQATAGRATLTNAVLELQEDPEWRQGERSIRAEVLRLDTRDRSFEAEGKARLRFPAAAFGVNLPTLGGREQSGMTIGTNLLVEVESERAVFGRGLLRFAAPVRAQLQAGEVLVGQLTCRDLVVAYSDRLERMAADGDVLLEQFGRPGRPVLGRVVECQRLQIDFDQGGRVRGLVADGGVRGRQTESRGEGVDPLVTRLRAELLRATFLTSSNQLDVASAEGALHLERGLQVAEGQRADYSGTNHALVLTGQPVVHSPEGRIRDAESLTWDSLTGKIRGRGAYRIEWFHAPTNHAGLGLRLPGNR